MGFWISGADTNGDYTSANDVTISPGPTHPEYGERFPYSLHETSAGAAVKQKLKKNPKELKWIWAGYGPSVPQYETLYWVLFNNQDHIRVSEGKSPYVYLKEDVTGNFGKYSTTTDKIEAEWVRCIITYVGRKERKGGGQIYYDETEVRFVIADSTITEIY